MSYKNVLSLSPYGKAIPYTKGDIPCEGSHVNNGFKDLKGHPELIDSVLELADDKALRSLVRSLNAAETSFFSIGCFSDAVRAVKGGYYRGYVEFAWNCTQCVQDAVHYFSLFFHFEQFLRAQAFEQPVKLDWVVEEAQFLETNTPGFCCAIYVHTASASSLDQAYATWQQSLRVIESFLCSIKRPSTTPIYGAMIDRLEGLAS